jgi:hypothetical protein
MIAEIGALCAKLIKPAVYENLPAPRMLSNCNTRFFFETSFLQAGNAITPSDSRIDTACSIVTMSSAGNPNSAVKSRAIVVILTNALALPVSLSYLKGPRGFAFGDAG